jgi:hypothetical protein
MKLLGRVLMALSALSVILGLTVISGSVSKADAAEVASVSFAYTELNCNWQGYTKGLKEDGVDLTWATGSGSSRKYIRAQRMATLFKNNVKSSLYGLTECDSQMLSDLAHLMGSNWKYIGGDNDTQNRTGWLYDAVKWHPGSLSTTVLPGDPDGGYTGRRLLQIGFFRDLAGSSDPMISLAMVHLSSGSGGRLARDLQMDASLDIMEGKVRLVSGDLNASSVPKPDSDPCSLTGPRWQMACRGWSDPMAGVSTFQDYGNLTPGLPVDIMSLSPAAQEQDKIRISNPHSINTASTYVTDHNALQSSVSFN